MANKTHVKEAAKVEQESKTALEKFLAFSPLIALVAVAYIAFFDVLPIVYGWLL